MIVTIHQPNFMPWFPFFQKVEQSDVFVILTHCQFEKNGFQNRFNLEDRWNTMSVRKGLDNITDKVYANPNKDWKRIKKTLFKYQEILDEMDEFISESLVNTNIKIIKYFVERLNIDTEIVLDYPTELKSTDRLVDLCKHYGATTYLAGQGGKDYLDTSLFNNVGIDVKFQENLKRVHTLEILK